MTSCYVITERTTSTRNLVMQFTSQSRKLLFAACYIIMEHETSTGNLVTQFTSRSWQPLFAVRKRWLRHRTQLTPSWRSITKTSGLSNMLRVQKGQMVENGYCDTNHCTSMFSVLVLYLYIVIDTGRSKEVPGMCPWGPNSFIFMQFSTKNLQNIRLVHLLWGVGTPSGKSWICH